MERPSFQTIHSTNEAGIGVPALQPAAAMSARYRRCVASSSCQTFASIGLPIRRPPSRIRDLRSKRFHSPSGMNRNRNSVTAGRRTSMKWPPPTSSGAPSTSALRHSPPASPSFSTTRKSSTPFMSSRFANVSPAGPAPRIR